jgi:hypothetical protein
MKKEVLVLSGLLFSGCATSWRLQVSEKNPSIVRKQYIEGYELAVAQTEDFVLGLTGEKQENDFLRIWVWVKNISDQPINFIPEKTLVTLCNDFGCENLETYAAYDYMKKMQSDQSWALAAQAFSGELNAQNAGKSRSTTKATVYGSAYGSNGYAYGTATGTSTTETYDAAAVESVRQRNQENIQNQAEQFGTLNNFVENGLVKSVTLFPSQEISGNIMVKHSSSSARIYKIRLNIENRVQVIYLEPVIR